MKNKICFVVPYFGSLPVYFPLFISSVKDQPFDVLFFTNIAQPFDMPQNVFCNYLGLDDLRLLFISKLNISISLKRPYKLCDYKPSYGLVFEEFIADYDFWGSIDIDIVMGNFNKFINDEILDAIDIYSGVREYLSGSFFLVRNNLYCNALFKKSKDWIKVFTNDKSFAFDECGGHYHDQLKSGSNIFDLNTEIQSFTEVILLEAENRLRVLFTDEILEPGGRNYVFIDKKRITYFEREYLLIHFIYFKSRYIFIIYPQIHTPPYYISYLGNFKKKPVMFRILFSKNFAVAIHKKIQRSLKYNKTRKP